MLDEDADKPPATETPTEINSPAARATLPLGTVAFLGTDIEGSTGLSRQLGEDRMARLLEWHHALLRAEFSRTNGTDFHEAGDGFFVVFSAARDALRCAHACQQALKTPYREEGEQPRLIRVRMAIHVADIRHLDRAAHGAVNYRGIALHDIARLMSTASGGQVFLSESAEAVLRRNLPEGIRIADRGIHHLRDAPAPEHIFEAQWDEMTNDTSPAPRTQPTRSPVLPSEFTRFFGRDDEVRKIADALRTGDAGDRTRARLLTLTGMGGAGKTRLAIEAARNLADDFAGAVWFVSLLGLDDPVRLPDAVRAVVTPAGNSSEAWDALAGVFDTTSCLLVLDNLEHLLGDDNDATADFVQTLLERFPRLSCLATSRQRIGIPAEQEYAVRPLPTPKVPTATIEATKGADASANPAAQTAESAMGFASVALFEDRARRARFDFEVTDQNAAAVTTLCARLEGIPLALELAAAWARLLTPAEMLTQFDAIRRSRDRKLPDRHRSLDAAIEGSYRLLDDDQQAAFRALSVFQGGWTLASAKAVCDDPMALALLADLRDRSLVVVDDRGDDSRYRFLETVRVFAAARLAEDPAEHADALRRHTIWYAALAAGAKGALRGPEQAAWLDRLSDEHQNLTAVLHRADRSTRLQIAANLERYWMVRGYLSEGRAWLEDAIRTESGDNLPSEVTNRAIHVAGILALTAGDMESAISLFVAYIDGCHAAGDETGFGFGTVNIAIAASIKGDFAQARSSYESTLELWRRLENHKTLATVLSNLGGVCIEQNDHDTALRYLQESLEQQSEDDDTLMRANTLMNLASVSIERCDVAAATRYASECFHLRIALADRTGLPNFFYLLAGLKECVGDLPSAAWWFGAVESAASHIDMTFAPAYRESLESDQQAVRNACGETVFENAWQAGRAASWEQIISAAIRALQSENTSNR